LLTSTPLAEFATERLSALGIPGASCERIAAIILATATHQATTIDQQLMVDAIRREYALVPDNIYFPSASVFLTRRFTAKRL
jgi:predicted metal-dependent HD superfamily phosphohydrolase